MDLNHIFLFLALITPLLVLAKAWRPGGIFRGWRLAAIIVLAMTGIAWLLFRDYAGYVGGGAWFVLLFVPAVGLRKASQFAAHGHFQSAARMTSALQFLHPTAEVREGRETFATQCQGLVAFDAAIHADETQLLDLLTGSVDSDDDRATLEETELQAEEDAQFEAASMASDADR